MDYYVDDDEGRMSHAVQILSQDILVACILLGLTALVGLLGNLLMLRALFYYKHLRIDFFILLGSVSVADILCLVIAVPRHIIDLTEAEKPVTDVWCKASKYLETGSGFVAAYHLVVLAVLRGILLTSRGRNPPTPVQTLMCVAVLWLLAMLAAVPFPMTMTNDGGLCHYLIDADVEKDIWMVNAFSCFVPLGLILVIYLLAHMVGKRYHEDSYSYREKHMSRLVSTIVGVFLVCQLPFRILDLHVYYREQVEHSKGFSDADEEAMESLYIAKNYLLCLMMADKAARPVIYSKLAPGLAEAFDEVVNCTMCHRYYSRGRGGLGANGHLTAAAASPGRAHNDRLPSTSSNAPLTGACSDEIRSEPEVIAL